MDYDFNELNFLLSQFIALTPKYTWSNEMKKNLIENFTFHSSKIEGMTLSYSETIGFLRNGFLPKPDPKHEKRQLLDISMLSNHKEILISVFKNYDSFTITESNIKELQKELVKHEYALKPVDIYNPEPGDYKYEAMGTYRIIDGKTVFHEYPDPFKSVEILKEIIDNTNAQLRISSLESEKNHPVYIAADFHYRFLNECHPFPDGNGRVARILTSIILMKNKFPPLIIKSDEKNKKLYMDVFYECEKSKSTKPMIRFLTNQIKENLIENINLIKSYK